MIKLVEKLTLYMMTGKKEQNSHFYLDQIKLDGISSDQYSRLHIMVAKGYVRRTFML